MTPIRDDLCILVETDARTGRSRGIFFAPARDIGAATVNEMARSGRGLVACCIGSERAFELGLRTMPGRLRRSGQPTYLASVEAASCTDTGISAADRAETLRVLGAPGSTPADLCTPGHVMPCLAVDDILNGSMLGLALEMSALLTSVPAAAWCDILDGSGEVASAGFCAELAARLGCPLIDVGDVVGRSPRPSVPLGEALHSAWSQLLPAGMFGIDRGDIQPCASFGIAA